MESCCTKRRCVGTTPNGETTTKHEVDGSTKDLLG